MLETGGKGNEVEALQRRLKAVGFDPGVIDGDFGPATAKAPRSFQKKAGIAADGICGPQTEDKLSAAINALTTEGGHDKPAAGGKGDPAPL